MTFAKIMTNIDNIQDKITEGEYLELVNDLKSLKDKTNEFYRLNINYTKLVTLAVTSYNDLECDEELLYNTSIYDQNKTIIFCSNAKDEHTGYEYTLFEQILNQGVATQCFVDYIQKENTALKRNWIKNTNNITEIIKINSIEKL